MQSNVSVENGIISGKLKYVTGYTGFSGNVAEQTGNYIALHVDTDADATVTVELINGTVGHPVTLDSDRLIVIRITDTETQYIEVVTTKNGVSVKTTYTLAGVELLES